MPLGREMREDGDGLHGLAESHLVAEQHPLLGEREPRPERLITAQGHQAVRVRQPLFPHPLGHLVGQKALGGGVGFVVGDLGEEAVVVGGTAFEVHPGGEVVLGAAQQIDAGLGAPLRYAVGLRLLDERAEFRHGGQRPLPGLAAGEQHPPAPGGGAGVRQQRGQPLRERGARLGRAPRLRSGLDEDVQRGDEGGAARFGPVGVEAYGDVLLRGLRELPGRSEHLVGGAPADARGLPQHVAPGAQHVLHGAEPARLQLVQPQPALGDIPEPGHGQPLQLLPDQLLPQWPQCLPYGVDGPLVVLGDLPGRLGQPRPPRHDLPLGPRHRSPPQCGAQGMVPLPSCARLGARVPAPAPGRPGDGSRTAPPGRHPAVAARNAETEPRIWCTSPVDGRTSRTRQVGHHSEGTLMPKDPATGHEHHRNQANRAAADADAPLGGSTSVEDDRFGTVTVLLDVRKGTVVVDGNDSPGSNFCAHTTLSSTSTSRAEILARWARHVPHHGAHGRGTPGFEVERETTVRLDERNRPEPDLLVTTAPYDPDRTWCAPEQVRLVVEVVSPSPPAGSARSSCARTRKPASPAPGASGRGGITRRARLRTRHADRPVRPRRYLPRRPGAPRTVRHQPGPRTPHAPGEERLRPLHSGRAAAQDHRNGQGPDPEAADPGRPACWPPQRRVTRYTLNRNSTTRL
ncbi:hypothetical protein GCM10020256_26160 [Streptomyces thermocoprophilus]